MIIKGIYKVIRSILFSITLLVVGLYVVCYTLVSIPWFTNAIKNYAGQQLSLLTGGTVEIGDLDIYPFNEIKVSNLKVLDPQGNQCLEVETIGAGLSLWKLVYERRFVLTYGEVIGLDAYIVQPEENAPLNIQFLIDAFSSKNPEKEKTPFDLTLRNVVLRKSALSFYRPWLHDKHLGKLDLSNLKITDLAADISFPKLSDKEIIVDLRRLSLSVPDAVDVKEIGFYGTFSNEEITLQKFAIELPQSRLFIPELQIIADKPGDFREALKNRMLDLTITDSYITPSDFAALLPSLENFPESLSLEVKAQGNINEFNLQQFKIENTDLLSISLTGGAENISNFQNLKGDLSEFFINIKPALLSKSDYFIPSTSRQLHHIISGLGEMTIKGEITGAMANKSIKGNLEMISHAFTLTAEGSIHQSSSEVFDGEGEVTLENLRLQELLPQVPISHINANIVAEGSLSAGNPQGMMSLVVENFEYKGQRYNGPSINVSKTEEIFDGDLFINNAIADIEAKFSGDIEGKDKNLQLDLDIRTLDLSRITDLKKFNNYLISGTLNLDAEATGDNMFDGELNLNNLAFTAPDNSKSLKLKNLNVKAESIDSVQSIFLKSDWLDARAEGNYKVHQLPAQLKQLAQSVFPSLLGNEIHEPGEFYSNLEFDILIKKNNSVTEFFNLPIRLLVPVNISGTISGTDNNASFTLDLPYLQQGKDKLIYDSKIVAEINGDTGILNALIETTMPVKRGDLALNVNLFGNDNTLSTDIHFINTINPDFKGQIVLDTEFTKNPLTRQPEINLVIQPAVLHMGPADWNISKSEISYANHEISIDNLKLWHDDQYVKVAGRASQAYEDFVTVSLKDIDVDYVFDMLQINYVTFGGIATGEITGHALLSSNPVAQTDSLIIKEFTYNGTLLGECLASSRWNNEEKEIEISADISQDGKRRVLGTGGIWIGKDSLSFKIEADKVPVDLVQPFMAVFSSHVGGFATGDLNLFGTFHDIDMTGKIFADSVAVKLDYTNTVYHGSDSVLLYPGRIEIPHFRLYDKFGNSAMLTGELTHTYFHDPSFTFRLSDANNFLCYDTNSDLNPDWYGTLYGSGSALLKGIPGYTDISADMTVSGNSNFTFVLNETQYARDYQFLTFSDKRKEQSKSQEITTEDMKEMLRRDMAQDENTLSLFALDIRASVTPQVLFTLVMDPAAGDKITARGQGALQVKYESDDDDMAMYGKYEITEGNYNFSLQDIILRDFKIKEGSYIAFNGNPLAADLDISATYRVNTNLSDLDKSFSTDRDLNRTNVPVDAVLSVTGNMTSPDITFDIELPTLTQDVERKVKSIISTDDMMNRQMIYLLALNRFYTPEYMGASGNGGELAAVASSTISSQLSNILGQLTDKFSVSPSFRSDKGDFSDIEVDVALSSRLLNNRLLINGNFGYRDRSNSSTTFVGDFDVEYLLSKNGNLRLKAYNHFNDQNYYLREALTTQGLGIVYRRDFDNWFTFLKKKKKKEDTGNGSEY